MDYRVYFEALQRRYEKYFDVEKNINILDMDIDMFAKFSSLNAKTFLTKNDVIDSYSTNEYCFIKKFDKISKQDVLHFIEFLKRAADVFVKPGRNHMSTYVTGVFVCNCNISDEIKLFIKKFKYSRVYKFYLHGWSDLRLVLVNLQNEDIVTNRAAYNVKKVYSFTPLK